MSPRRTARGRASALVAAALVAGGLLAACSDDGDAGEFCDRLASIPEVGEILGRVDGGDPGGARAALREGVTAYRQLEASAPGEVRADVARVRQGVELVLEAVEDNPDDLPAARQQITGRADELSGLVQAGQRVADYARTECGIALDVGGPEPAATDPTATDSTASTPASGPEDVTEPEGTTGTSLDGDGG